MKKIKINFVNMWDTFNKENNTIINILRKYYEVEISDDPQYLFFSVFSNAVYPEHLNYECVKIFYTGENLVPDFNLCDYAIGFEYIDYSDRYLRFPVYYNESFAEVCEKAETRHLDYQKEEKRQSKEFCSFIYSNGTCEYRNQLFACINSYKQVHSGGPWMNNIGGNIGGGVFGKINYESKHKFSIACENSSHPGYTTEKLIEAFAAGTIPIYWGDPWVDKVFNSKAFINCHEFDTLQDVLSRIKEIDNDDERYEAMLKEPILVDTENMRDSKVRQLETFLLNIMEQPYESAFRRNREYWGNSYLHHLKISNGWYFTINNMPYILKRLFGIVSKPWRIGL